MMNEMTEQQIGKFVDARSTLDKKWYAAEIVRVYQNGDVRIHFPGWTEHNDEIIPAEEVSTQISPLYSHSLDRRKWKVGDSVDYQCSSPFALWTPVSIVAVDHVNDSVAAQLLHEEINEVLMEHRAASSGSLVKEDSVKWFKICSDHIAPIHTFTKKSHKRSFFQALASALPSPPPTIPLAHRRSATIQTCRKGSTGFKSAEKCNYVPAVASPTPSTSSNIAHPTCTTNSTTASTNTLLPVASAPISPLQTSSTTAPTTTAPTTTDNTTTTTTDNTSTWLTPLLRARQASEQHVQLCEQALVRDEGFTDAALFAGLPVGQEGEMAAYLGKIGITQRGVQMKMVEVHKALQR